MNKEGQAERKDDIFWISPLHEAVELVLWVSDERLINAKKENQKSKQNNNKTLGLEVMLD